MCIVSSGVFQLSIMLYIMLVVLVRVSDLVATVRCLDCFMLLFVYSVCQITYVFCFNQKTAYEMRISAWSSDLCSSDLTRYGEAFSDSGGFNILARSTGDDLFLGSKNGISLLGGSAGTSVRLRIDGNGSIGIGQAPPSTSAIGIHVTDASWIGRAVDTPRLDLCANLHYDGTNWRLKRTASGAAALILEGNALNGAIDFYRVAGGTAGATASLSSQLAIGSDGILDRKSTSLNSSN